MCCRGDLLKPLNAVIYHGVLPKHYGMCHGIKDVITIISNNNNQEEDIQLFTMQTIK